jgi:predicted nucleic acid-binding protein
LIFAAGETLHAPHLMDLEVAHVLRRYVRSSAISQERGAEALGDLADLPIARYAHAFLLHRIWEMRDALTAYDAAYVALAETLDAPLITRDRALARAASRARVKLV